MESMFFVEAVGENSSFDRANSRNSPRVVGDGGDEEVFCGADGFEFGESVGDVLLEDFELFGGGADDLAMDAGTERIKAGAALPCWSGGP
jgi:hypothetical protein